MTTATSAHPAALTKREEIAEGTMAFHFAKPTDFQFRAEGIRVNITLCFSQQQAAAVYAATKGSRAPVYVSPFVGRLDDIGQNGVDLVRNFKRMLARSDRHVFILAASIRNLQHLLYAFHIAAELVTVSGQDSRAVGKRRNATPRRALYVPPRRRGDRLRGSGLGTAVGALQL